MQCLMYGMVWYGIFIFHRQYKVISKKNSKCNVDVLPMKGEHHITRRLSYHNDCSIKHTTFINKHRSYCGNGAAYKYGTCS